LTSLFALKRKTAPERNWHSVNTKDERDMHPFGKRFLGADLKARDLGFRPTWIWCPSPGTEGKTTPHPVPKTLTLGTQGNPDVTCKFTPLPPAVVVGNDTKRCLVAVGARRGWHRWNFVDFTATRDVLKVRIDFEGHTDPASAREKTRLLLLPEETSVGSLYELLSSGLRRLYPASFRKLRKRSPTWWSRPIYCGWGDQVAFAMHQEGPGPERRAVPYCIQGLYERWLDRIEQAGVPVGTVIVDAGWSRAGVWTPDPERWPDLRGFIRRQHRAGRRVLLWIATWLHEGLPEKWCIHLGGQRLTADPGNAEYRAFVRKSVKRLLSPEYNGYDADGFKVDQLAYVPTQRRPRGGEQFGRSFSLTETSPHIRYDDGRWGWELLYQLQKTIYDAAKKAKPDSLVTSSTVHPYFDDTFDMVRLHDTGSASAGAAYDIMRPRAELARAALPDFPIDADDWIHGNYRQWMDYTLRSRELGVPCIFYSERFVRSFTNSPATSPIPLRDLRRIARKWSRE